MLKLCYSSFPLHLLVTIGKHEWRVTFKLSTRNDWGWSTFETQSRDSRGRKISLTISVYNYCGSSELSVPMSRMGWHRALQNCQL